MVAAVSVTCGNVTNGTGDIRAGVDAVHVRVDGAPLYAADGTPKRYRLQIIPDAAADEEEFWSGLSHEFTPDANGDHQWDGYIFPQAGTHEIALYDITAEDAATVPITNATVASPSELTAAGHGLQTGQEVVIDGTSGYTPDIDGTHVVTVTGDDTFTIPVNVTVEGTGGTVAAGAVVDRTEVEVV